MTPTVAKKHVVITTMETTVQSEPRTTSTETAITTGLEDGVIAGIGIGIGIGSLFVIATIIVAVICYLRRKPQRKCKKKKNEACKTLPSKEKLSKVESKLPIQKRFSKKVPLPGTFCRFKNSKKSTDAESQASMESDENVNKIPLYLDLEGENIKDHCVADYNGMTYYAINEREKNAPQSLYINMKNKTAAILEHKSNLPKNTSYLKCEEQKLENHMDTEDTKLKYENVATEEEVKHGYENVNGRKGPEAWRKRDDTTPILKENYQKVTLLPSKKNAFNK